MKVRGSESIRNVAMVVLQKPVHAQLNICTVLGKIMAIESSYYNACNLLVEYFVVLAQAFRLFYNIRTHGFRST